MMDKFNFPNVITANKDEVNEEIDVSFLAQTCEPFELSITNRWGNLVYEGNQDSEPFNGSDLQGNDLIDGIYFYELNYYYGEKHGFIHVIR